MLFENKRLRNDGYVFEIGHDGKSRYWRSFHRNTDQLWNGLSEIELRHDPLQVLK